MAWLSTISADLLINKPLGLSPPGIEFKRAHLYDINPVGLGAMALSGGIAIAAHFGLFGALAVSFAPFIALIVALIASPLIAWGTGGRYYLARKQRKGWQSKSAITCSICEHPFEPEDMAWCPAYAGPICSLCCSLDSRCHDMCKPKARLKTQIATVAGALLPARVVEQLSTRLGRYGITVALSITFIGAILFMIAYQMVQAAPETSSVVYDTALIVFFVFSMLACIVAWFYVLAHDSRMVAEEESSRQTTLLLKEIAAHEKPMQPCRPPRKVQRPQTVPRAAMSSAFPTNFARRSMQCRAMPSFWSAIRPFPRRVSRRSNQFAVPPTICRA
nr:hypothetical protein [Marinicella sp. W31]MDC2877892.1 hypothetical protein [Marinicella sp. W31]